MSQADNTFQNVWMYIKWMQIFCLWVKPLSLLWHTDSGRARAAFTSLWPRQKKTATPWTRAAACSPASQRWCTTTVLSACLSTALSTWPCYTQCLASTDSTAAQPRYTKQTRLGWHWPKVSRKITSSLTNVYCSGLFQEILLWKLAVCALSYSNYFYVIIRTCLQLTMCL